MIVRINMDAVLQYCKDLQGKTKLTTADIADRTNIPQSTIENFFYGTTKNPGFQNMVAIILALGGSIDEALGINLHHRPGEPVKVSLDLENSNLDRAHAQTLQAKDENIETLKDQCAQLVQNNDRVRRYNHCLVSFIALENILFAAILAADMLNPTWGYFRYDSGLALKTIFNRVLARIQAGG